MACFRLTAGSCSVFTVRSRNYGEKKKILIQRIRDQEFQLRLVSILKRDLPSLNSDKLSNIEHPSYSQYKVSFHSSVPSPRFCEPSSQVVSEP